MIPGDTWVEKVKIERAKNGPFFLIQCDNVIQLFSPSSSKIDDAEADEEFAWNQSRVKLVCVPLLWHDVIG